jgi:hypothetical protein
MRRFKENLAVAGGAAFGALCMAVLGESVPTWLLFLLFVLTVALVVAADLLPEDLPHRLLDKAIAVLRAANRRLDERGER